MRTSTLAERMSLRRSINGFAAAGIVAAGFLAVSVDAQVFYVASPPFENAYFLCVYFRG
jgi:hypothetical protein